MNRTALFRGILSLLVLLGFASAAPADIEIILKKDFVATFKDRATMDVKFVVDRAHKKANPGSKDGDLHFAGRSDEVGLPMVSELMNAKSTPTLVDRIHEVEGTDEKLSMSGVWRLWCEHGGSELHEQGEPVSKATSTNPDHVFEIHPVTKIGSVSAMSTLAPIAGYRYKDASNAFQAYENIRCKIEHSANKIAITTGMAGNNYVEFKMKPFGGIRELSDGCQVFATVYETDVESDSDEGEGLLVRKRRMVFVKGSAPEKALRNLNDGGMLHVVGMPRINLSLLDWRVKASAERPEVLNWNLPYEIVIVAVLGDDSTDANVASRAAPTGAPLNEEADSSAPIAARRATAAGKRRPAVIGFDAGTEPSVASEEAIRKIIREEIRKAMQEARRDAAPKKEGAPADAELNEEKGRKKKAG